MKRIVFAHRKLSFGGGERVLIEQVAALADLPIRISVIYRKEGAKRDIEPELRARNPHVEEILHLPGAWAAGRYLQKTAPDLVVLCNHKGVQRALPWLARLGHRFPLAVTLHEHYARHLDKYRGIRHLVDRWLTTWAFNSEVQARLGDQPCAMIHPIYPRPAAVPADLDARQAARRALGLPEGGPVVGYVGQIDGRKDPLGVLRLAEATEAALGRPLHLVFAGHEAPDTAQALDRALATSPLRERTLRLGRVPATGPVLDALDAYLMTSRNEGFFPIALIEALERGVPIVAPSVGGIGTVLKDGEGGLLMRKPDDRRPVPPALLQATGPRLAALLGDPSQREKAVALARGLTEGYDAAARFREALAPWL
ncbi:MAG TPA: glycosyltransferase family 4 protein [Holophagaceae bacterium]|nr:glycosyltransferase family 4 protein [Holophagaceae bacterium]